MIVDAHHHVWQLARGDYEWPTPDLAIHRDYGLADLHRVRDAVAGSVLVQTTPTEAETRFLLDVARGSDGFVRGVVGWTDLASPDAPARIEALAADDALVGLRPMLQNDPDRHWILRDDVRPALHVMASHGLALDLLIVAPQLPQVPVLAAHCRDLRMVIDHAAKPAIRDRAFQPWADDIARAADAPNVVCKLSGLVTEAGDDWTVEDLRPIVEHLIAVFGCERLMWGSDWPVVELAGGYRAWADATALLLGALRPDQHRRVMGGTAAAFYRLDDRVAQ